MRHISATVWNKNKKSSAELTAIRYLEIRQGGLDPIWVPVLWVPVFLTGGVMSEIRIKSGAWPSAKPFTASVTPAPAPRRGVNPLQDSLMRLDESEQLRQQGKLERAQRICEALVREHPDYMAAQH